MCIVFVDFVLESEVVLLFVMWFVDVFECDDLLCECVWKWIVMFVVKFWVCKCVVELIGEVMEVFGGNGYVDDGLIVCLFCEVFVNLIWEGLGNVMCFDVLCVVLCEFDVVVVLFDELVDFGVGELCICVVFDGLCVMFVVLVDMFEVLGCVFV